MEDFQPDSAREPVSFTYVSATCALAFSLMAPSTTTIFRPSMECATEATSDSCVSGGREAILRASADAPSAPKTRAKGCGAEAWIAPPEDLVARC